MRHCKKALRKMIIDDCLRMGDFELSSGAKSNYYIDMSQISMCGNGAYLIGKMLYHYTKNLAFDAIGGPDAGVIPLVSAVVTRYWRRERRIKEGFWVRSAKNADQVRSEQRVEGRITSMHKAVIIEDVCSTGHSADLAVHAVRELVGCDVVKVIALVERGEGARERFQELGVKFDSVFKAKTLLDHATNGRQIITAGAVTGRFESGEK